MGKSSESESFESRRSICIGTVPVTRLESEVVVAFDTLFNVSAAARPSMAETRRSGA